MRVVSFMIYLFEVTESRQKLVQKFIMKSFTILIGLALVFAASGALNEEQKAKAMEDIRACREETGFSEEALRKLKAGDVSDNSNEAKVILLIFIFASNSNGIDEIERI